MPRVLFILCLALLVCFFIFAGAAHSFSPSVPRPAEATVPAPLSSLENSNIVAALYRELGPSIGCTLVDANIVLTLAGFRGQTEIWISYPEAGDEERLLGLKALLHSRDMDITKPFRQPDGHSIMSVIYNFRGIERCTKRSRITIISPYEASSGYKGFGRWFKGNCDQAAREGISTDQRDAIRDGVLYGYPDIAIIDFIRWMASGDKKQLPQTEIACIKRYVCPEPNFAFSPGHERELAIKSTVALWGTFLANFYGTPWHRSLQNDTVFQAARKKHDDDGRRYADELKSGYSQEHTSRHHYSVFY